MVKARPTEQAIAQNRPGTMQASVGLVETPAPFAYVLAVSSWFDQEREARSWTKNWTDLDETIREAG